MTWFWVLLGKYFDKRNNKKREPESQIFLTKAPKTFGEMSKEERKEFFRGVANQVLPKITSEEYISGNRLGAKMSNRKSRFMFDLPVFTDWLFYLFLFFLFANWFGSFNAVQESGGINTSTFSVISGSIDAAFGLPIKSFWARLMKSIKKSLSK